MTPPDSPTKIRDLAAILVDTATRHRELAEERRRTWEEQIKSAPMAMCPVHPGTPLEIDIDASAFNSARTGRVTLTAVECPDCIKTRRAAKLGRFLTLRGIPARNLWVTMETWDPDWESTCAAERRKAWSKVHEWTKGSTSTFLIILGTAGGTGKTALAVAALKAVGQGDFRCLDYRDLVEELLALDREDRLRRLKGLRHYRALLVDDFGNRHQGSKDGAGGNQAERDIMATILNFRFEQRLPTILTTNLDPDTFAGRLDDRTVDRIRAGRVLINASMWPSRRAAKIL